MPDTSTTQHPKPTRDPRPGLKITIERLNKEIKRRARVVGIFPNEASVIRLVGTILTDTNDEWTIDERRYLSEGSMALLATTGDNQTVAAITGSDL